jgi:diguanylate cyclase (GGDEF)-like protein/PAS domain S-box-containing protein
MANESTATARFRTLVESPHAGVLCTDESGSVRFCSRRAAAMFGYGETDVIGAKIADLILSDGVPGDEKRAAIDATGVRAGGIRFPIDLTVVSVKVGAGGTLVWIVRERTEGAEELEDPLTRLPNRAFCIERVRERIEHGSVSQDSFAFMIVGVDGIDDLTKRAGPAAGDAVVAEIANRLRHAVPGADLIGRLGKAEFCVIASEGAAPTELESLARTIAESLTFPFDEALGPVHAAPKIGVAIAPGDGDTADRLVEHAAAALERAKRDTATTCFYSAEVTEKLRKRRELQDAIRRSLDTNQFTLDFLPLIDLNTGAVIGAEALLRWHQPGRGDIAPLDFIPLAEEVGLMIPVGTWVVREALRNAKKWNTGGRALRVAVNVTARQLHSPGFTRQLAASIAASGCRPEWLELELTEGTAMHHAATVQMLLSEIRATGVKIALDDFGTGYSSMAFLKSLPVDIIKIDRTFVDGVPHDNSDSSIVRAIVAFALCTGRQVRAEGVTSIEQARWLNAEGCDAAQGFFFSKPIPADKFEDWLTAYHQEGLVEEP